MRQRGLSVIEKIHHINKFGGQNTTFRDTALPPENGDIAQNCRFDEVGSVTKRDLFGKLNATALEASAITSLYRYYPSSGTNYWFAAAGDEMYVSSGSTGTFTKLTDSTSADYYDLTTSGTIFTFVTYNDLCVLSDGTHNILQSDGVALWELGSCRAGTPTSGGNLDASAKYTYQIVFNTTAAGDGTNTISGAISNTVTTTAANKTIPLTNIPLGPTGTGSRVVYRTEGGGAAGTHTNYYKIAVIGDNTTTTYTDTTADTTATQIGTVTDDMPIGKYLLIAEERLFVAGNTNHPNAIFYSDQYYPHSIQTAVANVATSEPTDYYDFLGKDEADEIVGIALQLGIMWVFKRKNIRPYHVRGVPTQWTLGQPVSHAGCPASYSIAVSPEGIIYQGWDHFYLFNGQYSTPVIDEFPLRESVLLGRIGDTVGFYHRNKYRFAYTSADAGTAEHNRVGVYDMLRKQLSIDVKDVRCFSAREGDAESGDIFMGDSKTNGWIYTEESGINYLDLKTKTDLDAGTYDDCRTVKAPSEENPELEVSWDLTIDGATGDIDTGYASSIIDRFDTSGVYTSDTYRIDANRFDKLYWNEVLGSGDNVLFETSTGATEGGMSAFTSDSLTEPSGSTISSTADIFFRFQITFTCGAITQTPTVYRAGDYAVRVGYYRTAASETSVPFLYRTGYSNLAEPHVDKWFKKLIFIWESGGGLLDIKYEMDGVSSYTFSDIDVSTNKYRWETFFPSSAYGRTIRFQISKNDGYSFKLKEIVVIYTPHPII